MQLSASFPFLCVGACVVFVSAMHWQPINAEHARSTAFFGCEAGFTFETSHEAARCRRLANVVVAPLNDCPQVGGVTLTQRVDLTGMTDECVNTSAGTNVSVERACPPNYTKRVVAGPDRCELPLPEMIRAPSVPVAR
jgi:hypothetical protein